MTLQPNQIAVLKTCSSRGSGLMGPGRVLRFKDGLTVYAGFEFNDPKADDCVVHVVESGAEFEAWCADNDLRLTGISIDTRMFIIEPGSDDTTFVFKLRWA